MSANTSATSAAASPLLGRQVTTRSICHYCKSWPPVTGTLIALRPSATGVFRDAVIEQFGTRTTVSLDCYELVPAAETPNEGAAAPAEQTPRADHPAPAVDGADTEQGDEPDGPYFEVSVSTLVDEGLIRVSTTLPFIPSEPLMRVLGSRFHQIVAHARAEVSHGQGT